MLNFWYVPIAGVPDIGPPPPDPPPTNPPYEQSVIQISKQNVLEAVIYPGFEISKLPPRNLPTVAWTQCAAPNDEVFEIDIDIVFDFIPKDVAKVTVANKVYNQVGSLQECHATDMSWIHNRAGTGKLYINPEGTGITQIDLDTRIVFAWFPVELSNVALFFDGEWHDPRLILNNSQFQAKVGVTDRLFINPFLSSGDIECWNGDRYFDEPFYDYEWLTADADFRHGAVVRGILDPNNTRVVRKTFIQKYSRSDEKAKFGFAQITNRTEVKAIKMIFTRAADVDRPWNPEYVNLPENEEGKNQPLCFGVFDDTSGTKLEQSLRAVEAICVDPATAHESAPDSGLFRQRVYKWMAELTDPETGIKYGGDVVQVLKQDSQDVNKIKIVNIGSQVTLAENNTRLDFDNNYEIAEGDKIWVLGNGYRDKTVAELTTDGFDTRFSKRFTGIDGGVIEEPQDANHFCLVMLAGFRTSEISLPTFTKTGLSKPDETMTLQAGTMEPPAYFGTIQHYERGDVSVGSLNNLFCVGLRAGIMQGTISGKLEQILINSSDGTDGTPTAITNETPTIIDPDYGSLEESRETASLMSTLTVEYSINFRDESATTDESHGRKKRRKKKRQTVIKTIGTSSILDEYARALGIDKEVTIKTAIKDEAVALLVANSYYNSFKRGVIIIDTSEVLGFLLDHNPGRPVLLIRNRAIGGAMYEKLYLPLELGRSYGGGTSLKLMEGL